MFNSTKVSQILILCSFTSQSRVGQVYLHHIISLDTVHPTPPPHFFQLRYTHVPAIGDRSLPSHSSVSQLGFAFTTCMINMPAPHAKFLQPSTRYISKTSGLRPVLQEHSVQRGARDLPGGIVPSFFGVSWWLPPGRVWAEGSSRRNAVLWGPESR